MIFYFSGTGNTQKLARIIANKISEEAIDIEEAIRNNQYDYSLKDGERLGFAFPVYFCTIPEVFLQFIEKLQIKTADHYYGYIVVTDGGLSANAPNLLKLKLLPKALTINACFGLKTVDTCAFYAKTWRREWESDYIQKIDMQSQFIAVQIEDRTTGDHAQPSPFPRMSSLFMKPAYEIFKRTSYFSVSDKCTGCGLCAKSCPTQSIEIKDGHPVWIKPKCMICMRCLHHCPVEAIDYGNWTQGKPRYKAPI